MALRLCTFFDAGNMGPLAVIADDSKSENRILGDDGLEAMHLL